MENKNIKVNDSLVGFLLDEAGEPIQGVAQLSREADGKISLNLIWDQKSHSPITEWFRGDIRDGWNLPEKIRFYDGGDVHTLQFLRGINYYQTSTQLAPEEERYGDATIRVGVAVHDGLNEYAKIRMFTSGHEGLMSWFLPSTDSSFLTTKQSQRVSDNIGVAGKVSMEISLGSWINVSPRERLERFAAHFTTRTRSSVGWNEHMNIHQSLSDLLTISSLTPLIHSNDFGVKGVSQKWGDGVASATISMETQEDLIWEHPLTYLFSYGDIGRKGVKDWIAMRKNYSKGIDSFLVAVRNRMSPNDKCLQLGLAFEHLGYQIGIDQGKSVSSADGGGIPEKIRRVVSEIQEEGVDLDEWISSMAKSYNTVKHNKVDPQPDEIIERDADSALHVIRAWVGVRLGVSGVTLIETRDGGLISYLSR